MNVRGALSTYSVPGPALGTGDTGMMRSSNYRMGLGPRWATSRSTFQAEGMAGTENRMRPPWPQKERFKYRREGATDKAGGMGVADTGLLDRSLYIQKRGFFPLEVPHKPLREQLLNKLLAETDQSQTSFKQILSTFVILTFTLH